MKFLCTGDLHLDRWPNLAPVDRLQDQSDLLDAIVRVALEEFVDGVLLAGDIFNTPRPAPDVLRVFQRFARELAREDIPAFAITGNAGHDIEHAERPCALELFADTITLRRRPDCVTHWDRRVTVCTLPSVPVSRLVASLDWREDRDDVNEYAARTLLEAAREVVAQAPRDRPKILLLHWSVSGAVTATGMDAGVFREPVLPLEGLRDLGFDAIVCGHIHKPQLLDDDPTVFYVGSPMPLNHGEPGEHGVWIVSLADGITPQPGHARFVPIESRPFLTLPLEHVGVEIAEGAIVRVRGQFTRDAWRKIDQAKIRAALVRGGAARITLEPELVREDRARISVDRVEDVAELEWVERWAEAQERAATPLVERTKGYLERLG